MRRPPRPQRGSAAPVDVRAERRRTLAAGLAVALALLSTGAVATGGAAPAAASPPAAYTFGTPWGPWSEAWAATYAPDGDLYVSERTPPRVFRVPGGTGTPVLFAGSTAGDSGDGGPATSARFDLPAGLAVDPATGDLLISDATSGRVRRVDAVTRTTSTLASFRDPRGLAVVGGALYAAQGSDDRVVRVDLASGATTPVVGGALDAPLADGTGTSATLDEPWGLAAGPGGTLTIADFGHHAVRRYDPATGAVTTLVGTGSELTVPSSDASRGDGGPATAALLRRPRAVAHDSAGNLLVGDTDDARVRRVDAITGTITTVAGDGTGGPVATSGPGTSGSVSAVAALAVAADGAVAVGTFDTPGGAVALLGTAPTAPTGATASAQVGTPTSVPLSATGAPAPRWSTTGGALPPGLVLSAAGVVSGTPTTAGTWTASVSAANGVGGPATTALTVVVSPAPAPGPPGPVSAPPPGLQRWPGAAGGGVSVDASSHLLRGGRPGAVLVSSASPVDGVAGAVLAARTRTPLLLVDPTGLSPGVAAELRRVLAPGADVVVLGGPAAVPDAVVAQLRELTPAGASPWTVRRVAGADRAETAALVAHELVPAGASGPVLVADGRTAVDGASAVGWAVRAGGVVVLSDGQRVPRPTQALLRERTGAGAAVVPVGGPARAALAASADLPAPVAAAALAAAAAGEDRYATSRLAAERTARLAGPAGAAPDTVVLASGDAPGDAVVAAWAAAVMGGRAVLVPPGGLDAAARAVLDAASSAAGAGTAVVVGPTAPLRPDVERLPHQLPG